jgi:hypothetical protein
MIKNSPHKRPNFVIRVFWTNFAIRVFWTNKKNSNSSIFKIHKWLDDPFALALISPPLALSTKIGSFLAL